MTDNNQRNDSGSHSLHILRHNRFVIWTHWIIAFSSLVLIISGFGQMPFFRRHNIISLPGHSWAEQHSLFLQLHYVASAVLVGIILIHLIYHLKRKEFSLLPNLNDLFRLLPLPGNRRNQQNPREHFKYYSNQRLSYALTGFSLLLLIVSGAIKTYKNFPGAEIRLDLLQAANLLHSLGTYLLIASIIIHTVAVHLVKTHRPLIRGMIGGRVSRSYARKHFPRWVDHVESREKEKDGPSSQ